MKLKLGKTYRSVSGHKMVPGRSHPQYPKLMFLNDEMDNNWEWTYDVETGRLFVRISKDHPMHIESEWDAPTDSLELKEPIDIDKVTFEQLQRGVAKIWDSYRI